MASSRLLVLAGLICLLLALSGTGLAWAAEKPRPLGEALSQDDIKSLLEILENEDKRKALAAALRENLSEEADQKGEVAALEEAVAAEALHSFSERIDALAEAVVREARRLLMLAAGLPGEAGGLAEFFSTFENTISLLLVLGDALGGLLVGFGLSLWFRRFRPGPVEEKIGWGRRFWLSVRVVVSGTLPYLAAVLAVTGLFYTSTGLSGVRAFILTLLWVRFWYALVIGTARCLLSPGDANLRLLPLPDEPAALFWRWLARLAKYAAFYWVVSEGLLIHITDRVLYFLCRNTLLVVFPILITVLILRTAAWFKSYDRPAEEDEGKDGSIWRDRAARMVKQVWTLPAVIYNWIIFLFLIGNYEAGFSYLLTATLGTAGVGAAWLLVWVGADWVVGKLVESDSGLPERFAKILTILVKIIITAPALLILLGVWGVPVGQLISSRAGAWILSRGLAILLTVGILAAVLKASTAVTDWLLETKDEAVDQKKMTLAPIINTTIRISVVFLGVILILDKLGLDIKPVLAGAGIIGLGVGLGAQSLVKDIINGLFILFEDIISVGDWAVVGGKDGLVERVGLRTIRLRDLAGNVHLIPNSTIDTVTNMTKLYSRYVFDIGVAYREDPDEVMAVMEEVGRELMEDPVYKADIVQPLEIFGVDKFADSAVMIRARITTKPMRQWAVGRAYNRLLKKAFDSRNIEIPFPHRTVYMGQDKEGQAPPLKVDLGQKE